ncbi:MAG: hypothetical protein HJJLKODD_01934 [Phycisphaerae bacterium]|nr:hypothetical protein [Phycisphaerae bacterium]
MPKRRQRIMTYLMMFLGGTALLGTGSKAGCARSAGDTVLVSANFCFIFDCQNGVLGGTFNLCSPVPLLVDCLDEENLNP